MRDRRIRQSSRIRGAERWDSRLTIANAVLRVFTFRVCLIARHFYHLARHAIHTLYSGDSVALYFLGYCIGVEIIHGNVWSVCMVFSLIRIVMF